MDSAEDTSDAEGRTSAGLARATSATPPRPLVVLLHGYPEPAALAWRHQLPALRAAGHHVLAPDQRGYGGDASRADDAAPRARRLRPFRLAALAADVVARVRAAGHERADLVGHDWGAAVAWAVALRHPACVRRLAILNVPHPAVLRHHLRTDPAQMLRSAYIAFFQLPWLPEALQRAADFALMTNVLRRASAPGTFSDDDLARYRQAWSRPGALAGMLAWYRAAVRHPPRLPSEPVQPRTLIVWGARDVFLRPVMAEESLRRCADGRLVVLPDAGHFLQHEQPQRVNAELLAFLST